MRLYYTTTAKQDALQQKPSQSLGGFKSSNLVPNSSFDNLFADVSLLTLEKNLAEYIGLILVNERENETGNIKIWVNSPSSNLCKYKIAVVELNSINQSEMLPSINSKPLYAEFYEANSELNSIPIPNMVPNEMYGIWIERTINVNSDEYLNYNNCDYIYANQSPSLSEEFDIKISFNDVAN